MPLHRLACLALTALLFSCAADAADPADEPSEEFSAEVRSKTDAQVQAEIEAAAQGLLYTSESDYPYTFVTAKLEGQKSVTQALVREKLASYVDSDDAADKPLASLVAMNGDWPEWKRRFAGTETQVLNDALEKNLRGIEVIYFGRDGTRGNVQGVGVSIFIVGRTPQGNLAGVRTLAIWT